MKVPTLLFILLIEVTILYEGFVLFNSASTLLFVFGIMIDSIFILPVINHTFKLGYILAGLDKGMKYD